MTELFGMFTANIFEGFALDNRLRHFHTINFIIFFIRPSNFNLLRDFCAIITRAIFTQLCSKLLNLQYHLYTLFVLL